MSALQKHLLFPQEIEAAKKKNIARQSLGYDYTDQGLRLKSLIDETSIGKMVENQLYKMWGWFSTLGNFVSGLLGVFFIKKNNQFTKYRTKHLISLPNFWLEHEDVNTVLKSHTIYHA